MRQSLMAWFFMGAMALAAFDAFETMYADPAATNTAATESTTTEVVSMGREGIVPPPD